MKLLALHDADDDYDHEDEDLLDHEADDAYDREEEDLIDGGGSPSLAQLGPQSTNLLDNTIKRLGLGLTCPSMSSRFPIWAPGAGRSPARK